MSFKKTMLAVAAVGAITAANAVPAMALENIFNGSFRIKGDFTNFDQTGGNDGTAKVTPTGNTLDKSGRQTTLKSGKEAPSFMFLEQRARIYYTAKANDDLKLVTAFEIDSRWGDTSQGTARNLGGAIEADQVNIETKNVYLDFNIPKIPVNVKAGILPYMDSYKGIFLNADLASVIATAKIDNLTTTLGWSRAYDNRNGGPGFSGSALITAGGATAPGKFSLDVTTLDAKYNINKDLVVGATYYLTYDANMTAGTGVNALHTFGVNAAANIGPATVSGFVLAQTGETPTTQNFLGTAYYKIGKNTNAYAANVAGKVKVGPATLRSSFLYTSGDHDKGNNKAFQGVNQFSSNSGAANQTTNYADGQMTMLMETTKYAANTDRSLIYTSSNNDQGIIAGFFGADYSAGKFFTNANLGVAAIAKENNAKPINLKTGLHNKSDLVGTEINAEVGYKLYDNLAASIVGGYVFLGDYYKNTAGETTLASPTKSANAATPNDPWKAQVVLNYTF